MTADIDLVGDSAGKGKGFFSGHEYLFQFAQYVFERSGMDGRGDAQTLGPKLKPSPPHVFESSCDLTKGER